MTDSADIENESESESESGENEAAWQRAHRELSRLAKARAGIDLEEGRWLLAALRSRAHERLGFGSFVEYVERLFGYVPRLTQEKLRVAEALEQLPEATSALQDGQTCWSALRELTRVAIPATEAEWLEAARGRTVRDVERLVSGHARGSRPSDLRDERLERHVLRFEVSGDVLATFREAMAKLRRDAGASLDDDAALLSMARTVLDGPRDERRASYQIALAICPDCQQASQRGGGEAVEVGPEIAAMAACDSQHITHVGADGVVEPRRAVQDVPPATRRWVLRRDGGCCVFPGCRHANFVDLHHLHLKSEGGDHNPDKLVTVCGAHHRAIHRGLVTIEGSVATGLRFLHADGSPYGAMPKPLAADAASRAFRALRSLGFRECDARRALAEATHVGAIDDVETLVRRCLVLLTERFAKAG
jgi:hypothetical protein